MDRLVAAGAILAVCFLGSPPAAAQSGGAGLIPHATAGRLGLERMWFTRVMVDSARGGIAHLRQHISSTRSFTIYEVVYDGGKIEYSERDLDRFGDPLGKEGAERQAQQRVEQLEKQNLSPKLVTHTVPEITLYAATDRGLLQAIDGETGRTRWATEIGSPRTVMEAPGANDQVVAAVNGTWLYVLDAVSGELLWQRRLRSAPGAGPAVTAGFIFVPMVNGTVEMYDLSDSSLPPAVFKSHGRAMVQPVSTGPIVAWPTDRGDLNVAEANRKNMLFRIETNNAIAAPAASLPPSRLLVASTDGYVYCAHELSGALTWRFSTGEPISNSPVVIGDAIYIVTDEGSLFRLNSRGQEQWWTSEIYSFIAASDDRLYCLGRVGQMLILDAQNGSIVGALNTEQLDMRLVNKQTDRIFLATKSGVIQCLREVEHERPLLHIDLTEKPAAAPAPAPRRTPSPENQPTEQPTDADPFGGGAGSDPFGGVGGSGSSSSGSSEPMESDPFGADPFN